jgi:hypothetical protein
MVQLSFHGEPESNLRSKARSTMVEALEMLDALGDELPAAATLQHAIDRLSDQLADRSAHHYAYPYGLSDR